MRSAGAHPSRRKMSKGPNADEASQNLRFPKYFSRCPNTAPILGLIVGKASAQLTPQFHPRFKPGPFKRKRKETEKGVPFCRPGFSDPGFTVGNPRAPKIWALSRSGTLATRETLSCLTPKCPMSLGGSLGSCLTPLET